MMKKVIKIIRISTHTNLLKLEGIRVQYPVSGISIRIRYPYPLSAIPYPLSAFSTMPQQHA